MAVTGVPVRLLHSYLQRLTDRVEAAAGKLPGADSFVAAERDFPTQYAMPVIGGRAGYVREALAKTGSI